MPTHTAAPAGPSRSIDLEHRVRQVETRLACLAEALREPDASAVELHASELHLALSQAVEGFIRAARSGGVPEPMRRRLARASAMVATQRESLARATAALDRAIEVLMPTAPANALYAANGMQHRSHRGGVLRA